MGKQIKGIWEGGSGEAACELVLLVCLRAAGLCADPLCCCRGSSVWRRLPPS